MGANKEWCAQTCTRLKEAKLYLKTAYRDNCKAQDKCPDHCTAFALSDPADADYCTDCGHDHNISFNDCKALKEAIQAILGECKPFSITGSLPLVGDMQEAKFYIQVKNHFDTSFTWL